MKLRIIVAAVLAVFLSVARAEPASEVYRLSYRSAEELQPLLRPHLPAGVSLSGQGNVLIVRAEPAQHAEVARLLRELDTAPRAVSIQVRVSGGSSLEESGGDVRGQVGTGGARGTVRIYRSEGGRAENNVQQVRGLEGRPAFINTAQLLPVRERTLFIGQTTGVSETTRFLELNQGFYATARVIGGQVEVDLSSAFDQAGATPQRQRLDTTLSGQLGEWILVGSTGGERREQAGGTVYRSRDAERSSRQIWLKVDLL